VKGFWWSGGLVVWWSGGLVVWWSGGLVVRKSTSTIRQNFLEILDK